uniref:50S ribosomal protein L6 n=1 Tax=Nitzschia alba TaxID=2858 RepID=A0A5C0F2P8_NITAL|nr:50S ribosomal protein L6 [Nitzschia alba]QEI59599.1 50S ribosomal protein L6 [Nitzschia alba]
MSRIGKKIVIIPENVNISFIDSQIIIKGQFGILQKIIPKKIKIQFESTFLKLSIIENTKNLRSLHGLYRTLISNMIKGVSELFCIILLLKGVGYRAIIKDEKIHLNLGYSHPIEIKIPKIITVKITQNTVITLKSIDKEKLGLFAATIRSWRYPERYKGKGILYKDEKIHIKAGKTGK